MLIANSREECEAARPTRSLARSSQLASLNFKHQEMKPVCPAYLAGTCQLDSSDCPLRHAPEPAAHRLSAPCRNFQAGTCLAGDNCKFKHPAPINVPDENALKTKEKDRPTNKSGGRPRASRTPCLYFPTCSRGDHCHFAHDLSLLPAEPTDFPSISRSQHSIGVSGTAGDVPEELATESALENASKTRKKRRHKKRPPPQATLLDLPTEIILEIADYLSSPSLIQLALSNRFCWTTLNSFFEDRFESDFDENIVLSASLVMSSRWKETETGFERDVKWPSAWASVAQDSLFGKLPGLVRVISDNSFQFITALSLNNPSLMISNIALRENPFPVRVWIYLDWEGDNHEILSQLKRRAKFLPDLTVQAWVPPNVRGHHVFRKVDVGRRTEDVRVCSAGVCDLQVRSALMLTLRRYPTGDHQRSPNLCRTLLRASSRRQAHSLDPLLHLTHLRRNPPPLVYFDEEPSRQGADRGKGKEKAAVEVERESRT